MAPRVAHYSLVYVNGTPLCFPSSSPTAAAAASLQALPFVLGFFLFFPPPIRLLGGAGGADRSREPQGESDRAGGQHLLHPAGGAGEDPPGGAAGV